jgi:hypothetical protein
MPVPATIADKNGDLKDKSPNDSSQENLDLMSSERFGMYGDAIKRWAKMPL